MKTIISGVVTTILPYLAILLLGGWLVFNHMETKQDLSQAKWDLATMTNRAESAEYNLAQEKKWQAERLKWNQELTQEIEKFKLDLNTYTLQLQSIKNERKKTGTNDALSGDVTSVLKEFNNTH
mgnify:FL=1